MTVGFAFGRSVRSVRLAHGLTQEDLADVSDLSVDAIRRIERAAFSPSLKTMTKLSDGLGISLRTLFHDLAAPRRDDVEHICDFLHRRNRREVSTVWRVIRAIFLEG
jgi:transcriptional regulator with XRE-family HTH domain